LRRLPHKHGELHDGRIGEPCGRDGERGIERLGRGYGDVRERGNERYVTLVSALSAAREVVDHGPIAGLIKRWVTRSALR